MEGTMFQPHQTADSVCIFVYAGLDLEVSTEGNTQTINAV